MNDAPAAPRLSYADWFDPRSYDPYRGRPSFCEKEGPMKKLSSTICVIGTVAALAATAAPASAKGGAAGSCGPPGQIIRQLAKEDGSTRQAFDNEPPGQFVSQVCAPGHQQDGGI
jgi:hypothetical protein